MKGLWEKFRALLFLRGKALQERGAWFLAPLSGMWRIFAFCRNALYDKGLLPVHRVGCVVVSVGNITAGGTGKTPLVHLLARTFAKRKVAIVTRGYGPFPDEALLLQRKLPHVPIYVGKDRVASARKAEREGAELLLLDDGLQHRRLHRDFELVVLRGANPLGKGHFLPRGFLRDLPQRLQEADALFVSHAFPLNKLQILVRPKVERILDQKGTLIPSIRGKKVALFCAIGDPASFLSTLRELQAEVVAQWILADHARAESRSLCAFAEKAKEKGAEALICTEKDFVKVLSSLALPLPLFVIEIATSLVWGQEFWEQLIAKIDQKIDNLTQHG